MTRLRAPKPRRTTLLMTSSALGGALLLTAAPALANDECGAHAPGAPVVCTADGGPYDRITYNVATDLDLRLEDGAELTGGVDLRTAGASLRLTGRDAVLTSNSDTTLHVFASPEADVRIDVGDVYYTGADQEAVFVSLVRSAVVNVGDVHSTGRGAYVSASGTASFNFGGVRVTGAAAPGGDAAVRVSSSGSRAAVIGGSVTATEDAVAGVRAVGPDVLVSVGSVTTGGDDAHGVIVEAGRGAEIAVGSITTSGAGSSGMVLSGEGEVILDLGDVQTTGDDSSGVATEGGSRFSLIRGDIGSVTTEGDNAFGLYLYADDIALTGGTITTTGDESTGAFLNGYQSVGFDFEAIHTSGYGSSGVSGYAGADFDLTVGEISTQGDSATGVDVWGDGGLDIRIGRVTTRGDDAAAISVSAQGGGSTTVEVDEVETAGDYSTGVQVFAYGGDTTVDLGAVTTAGAEAHGVEILDAFQTAVSAASIQTAGESAHAIRITTLPNAVVAVTAGSLATSGEAARGVHVDMSEPGSANIAVETIATQGAGADGVRVDNGGDVEIVVGAVSTEGDAAFGVRVEARDEATVTAGSVSTAGDDAGAVRIEGDSLVSLELGDLTTTGDRAVGLLARGVVVQGAIEQIVTSGYQSHGVDVLAGDGVNLDVGRVRTAGADAIGVRLESQSVDIETRIGDVETQGGGAHGAVLTSARDIEARIGRIVVQGADAHGLVAVSDVAQTIGVETEVTARHGVAVDLTGSEVDFTLAGGGEVRGGAAGLRIDAWGGSHVVLNGAVSASDGAALNIKGGATVIDNLSGAIEGHVDLTGGDDVLNNAGRFTARGDSNFGAGEDVLNNTGLIDLAQATVAQGVAIRGLERLNNAGQIDLANGVAGDVLTLDGVLNGQTGNTIRLDLDLRTDPASDRIEAGGFEGLSNIVLEVQGQAGLGDTGVAIARSAMAQTGDEVDVVVAEGGFVDFSLVFADGEYRLVGDLAAPAFEPTRVAAGAQHQWSSGADVVSARFGEMRDHGRRASAGVQVWGQAFGSSNDVDAHHVFDLSGDEIEADLSHEVKSRGLQAGVDRAVSGSAIVGLLASAGDTELRFRNGDVTEYRGLGVGAYAHWISGSLSLGALIKADRFKLDYDWAEANLRTRSDGHTLGLRLDAGWRLEDANGRYLEPQASLSWSRTSLDGLSTRDESEVRFDDATSVVGRIGLRAGATMSMGEGVRLSPYGGVHLLNEFDGDNASTLRLAGEDVRVRDRAAGAWGRAVLGAGFEGRSGLGGFFQAEGDFGELEGFTARVGISFSW